LLNGYFIFVLYCIFSGVLNWLDSSAKADHSSPDKVSIDAFMTYCFVLQTLGLLMDVQFGAYLLSFVETGVTAEKLKSDVSVRL